MAGSFASASSQFLSVDTPPVTAAPFTMACFFNVPDGATQALMSIGDKDDSTHYWSLQANMATAGDPLRASIQAGGSTYIDATGSITASTWTHGCLVEAASNSRTVYRDGGNSATNTTTREPAGADRIAIGARAAAALYCNGLIAEVGVWTAALDASEIAALAKGWKPDTIRPSALVFYAPLVRTLTRDLWGGLTLTNNNGVTVAAHPRIIEPMRRGVRKAAAVASTRRQRLPLLGVG